MAFNPTAASTFYGSYNEGSRAPTAIELGCAFQDLDNDGLGDTPCKLPNAMAGDPPLKQVVSRTFEVGVRGKLAGALGYSASVYRTQNTDDIQFIASNAQGQGNFRNVGKFRWYAGYSYVRATYETAFALANQVNSSAVDTDIDGNVDTLFVNPGDKIPGIPEHQFKFRGELQAMPNWTIGTNVVAFSDQYAHGNENNQHQADGVDFFGKGKVAGYAIMNLDTRYKFADSGWQVFAKLNNVFDTKYYTGGMLGETFFDASGAFMDGDDEPSGLVSPGAPRAGWIGVRYEFGGKKASKASAVDFD